MGRLQVKYSLPSFIALVSIRAKVASLILWYKSAKPKNEMEVGFIS